MLFLGSMVAMLLANMAASALLGRFGRTVLIRSVYRFFSLNLLLFLAVFKFLELSGRMAAHGEAIRVTGLALGVGTAFFLWVGVFNLTITSMFWALMADLYNGQQSKRVFGFLGAGGTLGQLAGSLLTNHLVSNYPQLPLSSLLLLSVLLLEGGVQAMQRMTVHYREPVRPPGEPRPKLWSGASDILRSPYLLGICVYLFFYTFISSFIYFQKQEIVAQSVGDRAGRVGFFANVNVAVALMTLGIQLLLTGHFLTVIGLIAGLSLVPLVGLVGFLALARTPDLTTIFWLDILRRTANYAISRPSREVLFTAVPRQQKYLAKNFIDTVVYRAGDSGAAVLFAFFFASGTAPAVITAWALGSSGLYLLTGWWLGRQHGERTHQETEVGG